MSRTFYCIRAIFISHKSNYWHRVDAVEQVDNIHRHRKTVVSCEWQEQSGINTNGDSPIESTEESAPTGKRFGWSQLRFLVAALLFAAAVTKVVKTSQILAGGGLLGTMPRLLFVIAFEASAATWLLIGNLFLSWILTVAVFAVFVASTGYAIMTGQSCNCFGERFDPRTMLILDVVVLLLAGYFRPAGRSISSKRLMTHLVTAVVIGSLFAGASIWRNQTTDRTEPLEFLLADMLIGKSWPLNEQSHPGLKELNSGKWLVLVVREDCDHCRKMMVQYFSDPQIHRPDERTAIFIAGSNEWPFQLDQISFELPGVQFVSWSMGEPFVASPAIFLIDDGIIVRAADGNDSEHFIESVFRKPIGS